jgi:hypothetical protein
MDEIPSWFWMVIISGLSGMFGMILFYTAMLLRESTFTVKEARFILKESRALILSAKEAFKKINGMLNMVQDTIEKVSTYIIQPFQLISGFLDKIKSKVPGFSAQSEEPEYYPEDKSPLDDSKE